MSRAGLGAGGRFSGEDIHPVDSGRFGDADNGSRSNRPGCVNSKSEISVLDQRATGIYRDESQTSRLDGGELRSSIVAKHLESLPTLL